MPVYPTKLSLDDDGNLQIAWSDGQTRRYTVRELYDHCPAADAREQRKAEEPQASDPFSVIQKHEAQPRRIVSVRPVGRYAYNIRFNHGSSNGIYSLELLRELGQPVEPPP